MWPCSWAFLVKKNQWIMYKLPVHDPILACIHFLKIQQKPQETEVDGAFLGCGRSCSRELQRIWNKAGACVGDFSVHSLLHPSEGAPWVRRHPQKRFWSTHKAEVERAWACQGLPPRGWLALPQHRASVEIHPRGWASQPSFSTAKTHTHTHTHTHTAPGDAAGSSPYTNS